MGMQERYTVTEVATTKLGMKRPQKMAHGSATAGHTFTLSIFNLASKVEGRALKNGIRKDF